MAVRDWSKAKFTFVILLPIAALIAVPMVVWSYHTERPKSECPAEWFP